MVHKNNIAENIKTTAPREISIKKIADRSKINGMQKYLSFISFLTSINNAKPRTNKISGSFNCLKIVAEGKILFSSI